MDILKIVSNVINQYNQIENVLMPSERIELPTSGLLDQRSNP